MANDKKLFGVYLPISLIRRIKVFIRELFIKKNIDKSHSEIVQKAVEKYLDEEEKKL